MSEADSFIQEVTEEVRQDRMFALWKRYAPYAIGGVALVVAAAAGWTWLKDQERREAEAQGQLFIAAESGGAEAYRALAETQEGLRGAIARMRLGGALAAAGDRDGAAKAFEEAAAMAAGEREYADLARLEALRQTAPEMTPEALIAALEPLAADGAPYRALALELRAVAKLNAGDVEGARADLSALQSDPETSPETQSRAAQILLLIEGK